MAHWRRHLFETVFIFGDKMDDRDRVYMALNGKVMFNALDLCNFLPLSMAADDELLKSTNHGAPVVLKLEKFDDSFCNYFDVKLFSDFGHQKERLFCGSRLKLDDIYIEQKSYATKWRALQLMELILKGNLFHFPWNESLFSSQTQHYLIKYIDHCLEQDPHRRLRQRGDENRNYFQSLFENLLRKHQSMGIFISVHQIALLQNDLKCCFVDDDHRGRLLADQAINVRFLEDPIVITIDAPRLEQMKRVDDPLDDQFGEMSLQRFIVKNGNSEKFEFELTLKKKREDQRGDEEMEDVESVYVEFCLFLRSSPKHIVKAKVIWDFVAVEVAVGIIERPVLLKPDKCDIVRAFPINAIQEMMSDQLTVMVNIKIFS